MVFLPKPFPSIPSQRHPIHPRQGALEVGGAVFDQQRSDVEATRHDEEHDACWNGKKQRFLWWLKKHQLITHDGSMVLLYMVLHGSHQYTPLC